MIEWEGDKGNDHVILNPMDFIAVPIGVQRRFECIDVPQGKDEGILFAIISGESPAVEWSLEAVKLMSENGAIWGQSCGRHIASFCRQLVHGLQSTSGNCGFGLWR